MTEFKVDADELSRMADQASRLCQELTDSQLPQAALDGVAGAQQVQDAYSQFVGKWSDGLFHARKHLGDLADRLGIASSDYRQTEQHIIAASSSNGPGA